MQLGVVVALMVGCSCSLTNWVWCGADDERAKLYKSLKLLAETVFRPINLGDS
jgi:hypothetical protein